jgi:hypothetical protein
VKAGLALGAALLLAGCAGAGAPGSAGPGGPEAAAARAAEAREAEARAAEAHAAEVKAAEARAAAKARAAVAATLLRRAEDQATASQYRNALILYDEFLRQNPGDPAVPHAKAARTVVERLIVAQTEIERLRKDADSRQAEIDRLKADLERLRRIDLRPAPTSP